MSYSEDFSRAAKRCEDNGLTFERVNDACLAYTAEYSNVTTVTFYDFLARTVTTVVEVSSGNDTSHIQAFAAVDAETLAYMRDKLAEMGGNPPPLPKDDSVPSPIRKNTP